MTATRTDIIDTFLSTPVPPTPDYWDIDGDTYINHVPLTLDRDWDMGYLFEVVEGSTSVVSYLVVVCFGGPDETGRHDCDSEWWPGDAGTFFDRRVSKLDVSLWAVSKIHGLFDSWQDRRAETFSE